MPTVTPKKLIKIIVFKNTTLQNSFKLHNMTDAAALQ